MVKAFVVAYEQPGRRSAAVISVLADRILGLFVLLLVALVGVLVNLATVSANSYLTIVAWSIFGLCLAGVVGASLFFSEKVRSSGWVRSCLSRLPSQTLLRQINEAFYAYKFHRREVMVALFLSLILQVSVVCTNILFRRVDVLVTTERGETVGEDGDHRTHTSFRDEAVDALRHVLRERLPGDVLETAAGEADQIDEQRVVRIALVIALR